MSILQIIAEAPILLNVVHSLGGEAIMVLHHFIPKVIGKAADRTHQLVASLHQTG